MANDSIYPEDGIPHLNSSLKTYPLHTQQFRVTLHGSLVEPDVQLLIPGFYPLDSIEDTAPSPQNSFRKIPDGSLSET